MHPCFTLERCFQVSNRGIAVREGKPNVTGSHRYGNSRAIWNHSVTYHLAEVTFPPLPQPKLVLDLSDPGKLVWGTVIGLVGLALGSVIVATAYQPVFLRMSLISYVMNANSGR